MEDGLQIGSKIGLGSAKTIHDHFMHSFGFGFERAAEFGVNGYARDY